MVKVQRKMQLNYKRAFLRLFLFYGGLVLVLFFMQRSLLYVPIHGWISAHKMGLQNASDITYQTRDGLTLQGWYQKAEPGKPTLVLFHGNQGKLATRAPQMQAALKQGFGVLATSYRGYSDNPGKPTEDGLYADAEAALAYLNQQGITNQNIILVGRSLGTGIAVEMATRHELNAIVLITPYTSIADAAQHHYWYVPAKWLVRDRFDNLKKAGEIDEPVLIFHGTSDKVVPYDMGQELYDAIDSPKHFITVENGNHNAWDFDWLMGEVRRWLKGL